jgi:hypothetical protein
LLPTPRSTIAAHVHGREFCFSMEYAHGFTRTSIAIHANFRIGKLLVTAFGEGGSGEARDHPGRTKHHRALSSVHD